ncbi:MAG: polysaccharide deacetylase family protein [Desulfuromonadales bacterium]|nr:MAG: polysaccharide deacetylase family protein [Desulfuromonadales bacterium]
MVIDPLSQRLLNGAGLTPASQGRGPVVLMYHSITSGDSAPDSRWAVSEKSFREQLRLLKSEGWHTVCVHDLEQRKALTPKSVVITFDDGFADNYENGLAHLLTIGFKATWFVVSGDVGGVSRWRDNDAPQRPMLNGTQLREMAAAGMEIGAHTRTHARLIELDQSTIDDEVRGSRQDLEDMLGHPVTSFAYPYGRFNEASIEAVRRAGFRVACTTRTGWLGSEPDPLRVRRVAVFANDDLSTFARKIVFADTNVSWSRMARYVTSRITSRLVGG